MLRSNFLARWGACCMLLLTALVLNAPVTAQTTAPAGSSLGGIQSANIFEVKPDADQQPGYAEQTNAERARVQPGNNAPMWRQVNSGEPGYSSLPRSQAPEAGVLIQRFVQYPGSQFTTAGEAWRQVRNQWLIPYGGALLLIALVAIALFYFAKGPIKVHGAETGRKIERFTYFERAAHWVNAAAFVILALSGIVMAFGRYIMLPWMGSAIFGKLTWILKTTHNFVGPVFAVSLLVVLITFAKDNVWRRYDWTWLRKGGGLLKPQHVSSGRFNAGEKLMFWVGMLFLGVIVVASGLWLDRVIPGIVYTRGDMQIAHMIHAVSVTLMMCMLLGHIYLGTIGMHGAYKAMKTGYVDETWAREHHDIWFDDIQSGKIPAQRSADRAKNGRSQAFVRPSSNIH
ncbi:MULTISPECIES: formate dehydrogenase subunit gamma [unclassified Bordetella]|uniref:formate dehydrogenase subunit gamma n=1 Tax=unclassified Bordetella TaxID=2630031 RepID=UPI001322FBEC|nr:MULTISPECIES: formate dehydrogenase subunit gamma [unclassified Bordetella]MVW72558.1 formate dehydrogenase subunit gamma [Bordetella sp. 15P40C-2]MVW78530.1 formate dehydrogenase subunit gamma [Bordetella sp. 02P26C-1]